MELFSLLAKLTLDKSEYEKGLEQAKSGAKIELPDPTLGIDKSEFDTGISDANSVTVDDPDDPELGLDKSEFDTNVQDAEGTEVSDPDEPELGLDTSEFKDNIDEAESIGSGFGESMKGVFSEIKGSLAAAGITAALAGVINFMKQGVNMAKEHGDAIDKQSKKLTLSTKSYQELDYALTLSGASITDMTRAMRQFNEIQGGKITEDQASAFETLGVSITDASGKVKSAEQLMEESLYALADYSGDNKGLIQEALFGRNSAGLNALLQAGSEGIKQMRQEANDLGLVMTPEEVQNAANYMDATTRLEKSLDGLKESFAGQILPLLTDAANTTAKIIAFFSGRTGENSLSDEFKETDKEFSKNLASIEGTSSAAMDLIDKLFAMGDAEKLTAEQQAEWKQNAEWLINNIPELSGVIDTDTLSIKGNREEIEKTVAQWKALAQEKAIAAAKEAKYNAMIEKNSEAIDAQANARTKANDATKKYYERIAIANKLLENEKAKSAFQAQFGVTEVSADAENVEEMLGAIERMTAFLLQDNSFSSQPLIDATVEYKKLLSEQNQAEEKAASYKDQLDKAQTEYNDWLEAINELYGIEETDAKNATTQAGKFKKALDEIPEEKRIQITFGGIDINPFKQAKGNAYVPYDNYPSMLHRGEMVLTASEARRYRGGDSGGIDYTALENKIIDAIKAGMEGVEVNSYLYGQDVTDRVSRNLAEQLANRRYV